MKFLINTNYDKQSAGGRVLRGLVNSLSKSGHQITENDWQGYEKNDVVIFMASDSQVRKTRENNSKIICGIFDPKLARSFQIEEAKAADFLLVSSIEQREAFLKYNKNIFIYYMFPDVLEITKTHVDKDKIIIGYHGNKQHLDAMSDVADALDRLAKKHNIELLAIYNIKKLGRWTKNTPRTCPVRHIQWEENKFVKDLSESDIGIVPSLMPAPKMFARPIRSFFFNREGYNGDDYVLRFKMSNNPGRIFVFSQLHIPVVTDFTPSVCELIRDEYSGCLVNGVDGWYRALENLIENSDDRNHLSTNLKQHIESTCSIDINVQKFLEFLGKIKRPK